MRARGLLVIVMGLIVSALPAAPAGSAEIDFAVTPSNLEILVAPGGSASTQVTIYNHQSTPLVLDTYVRDTEIPAEDVLGERDASFSAARWLSFGDASVTIEPQGQADVVLRVRVPRSTTPGGYDAIGYLQSDAGAIGGSQAAVSGRIGVTVLVEVVANGVVLVRSVRESSFDVSVGWSGPLTSTVVVSDTIENTGDVHVLVGGTHTYSGWPGASASAKEVGPLTLLRGTVHEFVSSSEGPLFGRVRIRTEIVYQRGIDDFPVIVGERTVWVIPWHLAALLLAVGASTLVLVRRRRRAMVGPR